MELTEHKKDWEEMATLDPLWAILSDPAKRFNGWDLGDFFATGKDEVDKLMAEAKQFGHPTQWIRALDFGCGVGRLTSALHSYFPECHGVDISHEMVRRACEITPECLFHVNAESNLKLFQDSYFDFIYSVIVLQHQPNRVVALDYVTEFLRVLAEGGLLVFQLPCNIPLRNRIQGRRRLYAILRRFGWDSKFLYRSLKLAPMRMVHVPEKDVLLAVRENGGKVLDVRPDDRAGGPPFESRTYFVSR